MDQSRSWKLILCRKLLLLLGLLAISGIIWLSIDTYHALTGNNCCLWGDITGRLLLFLFFYYVAGAIGFLPIPKSIVITKVPRLSFRTERSPNKEEAGQRYTLNVKQVFIEQMLPQIYVMLSSARNVTRNVDIESIHSSDSTDNIQSSSSDETTEDVGVFEPYSLPPIKQSIEDTFGLSESMAVADNSIVFSRFMKQPIAHPRESWGNCNPGGVQEASAQSCSRDDKD